MEKKRRKRGERISSELCRGGLLRYYYLNRLIHQFDWVCVDEGTVLNWPQLTTGGLAVVGGGVGRFEPFSRLVFSLQAPQFLILFRENQKNVCIIHL